MKANIFLTGFSGSGKTTVAAEVARRLGWRPVDLDDEIANDEGMAIDELFRRKGEAAFRALERRHLEAACGREGQVVATGGGIAVDAANRRAMAAAGLVVCLEASPETIYRRLQGADPGPVRPLLAAADPLERIASLKAQRQPCYALARWTVHTDDFPPGRVADEVVRAWHLLSRGGDHLLDADPDLAAVVRTSAGDCPVWVGWGILDTLGERVRRVVSPTAAYVVTDEMVQAHAGRARASLEAAGIATDTLVIPPGEQAKNLDTARLAYQWLAERRAERGHLVVAVGGGVVGDLAGFVAATYVRGMPFAQVPTTVLAMVDAAIGGKTGVDLPQGKNLVGAFYQPRFVLSDVQTLTTLPARQRRAGWAEAIKHGLILDEGLLASFEAQASGALALDREVATDLIRRSTAIKAGIVSRDERETMGIRALLNYGHTIGHAVETSTGYASVLHGEAVAIGMMGAAHISRRLGMLSAPDVARQEAILRSFGLATSLDTLDADAILAAIQLDKKTVSRAVRWVLLAGMGNAVSRSDVPEAAVRAALDALRRPGTSVAP